MTPRQQVKQFNEKTDVGDWVYVVMEDGSVKETRTRARAQVIYDGSAVVWVDNYVGTVPLGKVTPSGRKAGLG